MSWIKSIKCMFWIRTIKYNNKKIEEILSYIIGFWCIKHCESLCYGGGGIFSLFSYDGQLFIDFLLGNDILHRSFKLYERQMSCFLRPLNTNDLIVTQSAVRKINDLIQSLFPLVFFIFLCCSMQSVFYLDI